MSSRVRKGGCFSSSHAPTGKIIAQVRKKEESREKEESKDIENLGLSVRMTENF